MLTKKRGGVSCARWSVAIQEERRRRREDPPPLAFPSLFSRLVNHPLSLSAPFASSPSPFLPAFAQPLPPPSPSPHVNRVFLLLLLLQQQRKAQGR